MTSGYGTLSAIGLGPGDPELLTLKGLRLLRQARYVFVPQRSAAGRSYALDLAWSHLDLASQEVVPLLYPMPAAGQADPEQWRFNAAEIARRLASGLDGAFLTEGDPLLYSTFGPTLLALRDGFPDLPVAVVPGVSSVAAAAALAQQPLAQGAERLAILPATADEQALRDALASFDTVVLLKVAERLERVLDLLAESGRADRAVLVERVGTADERLVRDVRLLRGERVSYFSLVVVYGGETRSRGAPGGWPGGDT